MSLSGISGEIPRQQRKGRVLMEIGSIFEINPHPDKPDHTGGADGGRGFSLKEVDKYARSHVSFTASGREAVALVLKSLEEKQPGIKKECLLPAYMCDSVFFPFEHRGWKIHFYHLEKDLRVREKELRRQIEAIRPGLLFVHCYYGVDTWKSIRPFWADYKKRGTVIMEDVTQSYYLPEGGLGADYVVGSLRKWYPVPDGGFAASDRPLLEVGLPADKEFIKKRMGLLTKKWEYLHNPEEESVRKESKEEFLRKNKETEEWLDGMREITAMSEETKALFQRIEEEDCKQKRKENYRILSEKLQGSLISAMQEEYENTAPLYVSIDAKNRDLLQRSLKNQDIYAPVLWPVGRQNQNFLSETDRYLFDHLLALPMDQRYGREEMERIAEVVNCRENAAFLDRKEDHDRDTGGCQ